MLALGLLLCSTKDQEAVLRHTDFQIIRTTKAAVTTPQPIQMNVRKEAPNIGTPLLFRFQSDLMVKELVTRVNPAL